MGRPGFQGLEIPRTATLSELVRMLEGEPPYCWLAFAALAERGDPAAIGLLLSQCGSSDPYRRRAAVEAIGHNPLGHDAIAQVRTLLADPSPIVQRAAAEAAGALRDQESHDLVRALLKSRDLSTRGKALETLSELWQEGDFEHVFALAARDRDQRIRKEASWVLHEHIGPEWRRVVALWMESETPRERGWVCDFLAGFGEAEDRAIVERFLGDRDGHVRERAEAALAIFRRRNASA